MDASEELALRASLVTTMRRTLRAKRRVFAQWEHAQEWDDGEGWQARDVDYAERADALRHLARAIRTTYAVMFR